MNSHQNWLQVQYPKKINAISNIRLAELAKPKRQRKKFRKPSKIKIFTGVRKSALKARCNSQIKFLSHPLQRRIVTRKRKRAEIHKAALNAKPSKWNETAALPKLKHVNLTNDRFKNKLPTRQKNANRKLYKTLIDLFLESHPPRGENNSRLLNGIIVHKTCCMDPRDKNETCICDLSLEERRVFQKRMILMAQPKPKVPPFQPDRGPKKNIKDLRPVLDRLAKPLPKKIDKFDPFKVNPKALKAKCTSYLAELARHREPRPPAPVYDFRGNEILPPRKWKIEARRRVITTKRTEALAIPKRKRAKVVEDVKEDPFRVIPAALTAHCSDRLAYLAKPINRLKKWKKKQAKTKW